jgi:acyl-CoA reductase-like NAD-dependent aldehyde dehydrogenase
MSTVGQVVDDDIRRGEGATVDAGGGSLDRPGYFYAATVLTNVAAGARIVDVAQFGPALPVIAFSHLDEIIERASSPHLRSRRIGMDVRPERGQAIGLRPEAGSAWVNTHAALRPDRPLGELRWSGQGIENGRWGYQAFTDLQVIHSVKQ